MDYPIEDIVSEYWSNNVIYRPFEFDAEHVSLIYKDVIEYAKQSHQYIDEIRHMTEEEKLNAIENNTFLKKCCIWRAKALRDRDPTQYSMVIGSLGFKQADADGKNILGIWLNRYRKEKCVPPLHFIDCH